MWNNWFIQREDYEAELKNINPDNAMYNYGESDKFTAFIWVLNKKNGQSYLYSQPGNQYHGTGSDEGPGMTKLRKSLHFKERDAVAAFGRFGLTPKGGFVTIWNVNNDEVETDFDKEYKKGLNRGFNQPNNDDIKILLKGLLGESPIKIIGVSPARLPITKDYTFVVKSHAQTVGEFLGDTGPQEDPTCRDMQINIQGRLTPLDQVQAQLHMVKGQQLSFIKGAFCTQYQALKNSPSTQHCKVQHQQIDDIASALKCGDDKQLYKSLLQAGKLDQRQNLRNIFSNPERITQQFRTQKDVDAAWDKLQGEHSFREWLDSLVVPASV